MKPNKYFLILTMFFILIFSVSVYAERSFEVEIDPIKSQIYPDEYALFNITITNTLERTDNFLFSSSHRWIHYLEEQFVGLAPNESKSTVLSLKPRELIQPGKSYAIPLEIKAPFSNINQKYDLTIYLRSYDVDYGEYVPSLNLFVDLDEPVNPLNDLDLNLRLINRNPLNIKNMTISIDGEVFEEKYSESIEPLQEKAFQFNFNINNQQEPGDYNLKVDVIINNRTYSSLRKEYTIGKFGLIEIDSDKEREFLKTLTVFSLENIGNSRTTRTIELEKNWIQRLFITSNIDFNIATNQEGKAVMQWIIELEPGQTQNIVISTNYRLLFIIILLLILLTYLYFTLRSPIIIRKKASILKHKTDEGASKFKIKIFIKNRSSKKMQKLEIKEKLSKLTEISHNKNALGTITPSKIIKGKNNTIVKWHINELEPFEERIITYSLDSKLKLVGSIQFPQTILRFKDVEGKTRRTKSNKLILSLLNK